MIFLVFIFVRSFFFFFFFFSSRRRHTRLQGDWSSDVCSSDLFANLGGPAFSGSSGQHHGFDWGLSFFFGRSVYTVIEGSTTSRGSGPYFEIGRASCRERV